MTACATAPSPYPQEVSDAVDTVNNFYDAVKSKDADRTYQYLSDIYKSRYTKEDFESHFSDNYDFYYKSLNRGMLQNIDNELGGTAFVCRFSGSNKYACRDSKLSVVNVEWENGKIVFNVNHHDSVSGFSGTQIGNAYFMGDIMATSGQ